MANSFRVVQMDNSITLKRIFRIDQSADGVTWSPVDGAVFGLLTTAENACTQLRNLGLQAAWVDTIISF